MKKLIFLLSLLLISNPLFAASRFKIGEPGYLMDACNDALKMKNTFESGYCMGVYDVVMGNLIKMGTLGISYCPTPKESHPDSNMAIIANYIKKWPKSWHAGDDYIVAENALKAAFPCPYKGVAP